MQNINSFFFGLVERHLPIEDQDEENHKLSYGEFFLWMIGLTLGVFILRFILF
jgi:hypothetical protein